MKFVLVVRYNVFKDVFQQESRYFQISTIPFEGEILEKLKSEFSYSVVEYLTSSGLDTSTLLEREFKTSLMYFCERYGKDGDVIQRKEFFGRLKSTLRINYPNKSRSFVSSSQKRILCFTNRKCSDYLYWMHIRVHLCCSHMYIEHNSEFMKLFTL